MHFTHFGHACVLIETNDVRVLFDPGSYSAGFESLDELNGILFTHQHPDHLDIGNLQALVSRNKSAQIIADEGSMPTLKEHGFSAQVMHSGESRSVGSLKIDAFGGEHAQIHADIPVIPNIGFSLDDGQFVHPGDSFAVPDRPVDVLGLPTAAPWLKAGEAVDYFRAVNPRLALPIHEALLARPESTYKLFSNLAPDGSNFTVPTQGEPIPLVS